MSSSRRRTEKRQQKQLPAVGEISQPAHATLLAPASADRVATQHNRHITPAQEDSRLGHQAASGAKGPSKDGQQSSRASLQSRLERLSDKHPQNSPSGSRPNEFQERGDEAASSQDHSYLMLELLDAKLSVLLEQASELERERIDIERMEKQLQLAIENAEAKLASSPTLNPELEIESLDHQVKNLQQENSRLASLLSNTRSEHLALLEFIESDDVTDLTNAIRNESREREIELCVEIDSLKAELERIRIADPLEDSGHSNDLLESQIEELRRQLIDARRESVELRLQCNELTDRLAKYQAPASKSSETWNWEERKQALLQQLENESSIEEIDPKKKLEIEDLITRTDEEISRRDREIQDLKRLLEEQAVAANGVAVGAATIAQFIESDELIIEERQRLKSLQEDWEQKQRQAEIEMSLERAKLARERLELQEKLRSLEQREQESESQSAATGTTERRARGKWLQRLGLRDE